MTTRHRAYLVLLEDPIRDDDEFLISAIRQLRGVADVQPINQNPTEEYVAQSAARLDTAKRLQDMARELIADA